MGQEPGYEANWGWCPPEDCEASPCTVCPRTESWNTHKVVSIFIVSKNSWALPPYIASYLCTAFFICGSEKGLVMRLCKPVVILTQHFTASFMGSDTPFHHLSVLHSTVLTSAEVTCVGDETPGPSSLTMSFL